MTGPRWKEKVRDHFDAAAETYDGEASFQAQAAEALAEAALAAFEPPQGGRGIDVGCGTGALSAAILSRRPHLGWLATDVSPRMAAAARDRLARFPQVEVRTMDGEAPDFAPGSFDLICSSLALQWFEDPCASLRRLYDLLPPRGMLAVSTLGQETFREWKAACILCGCAPATPSYPSAESVRQALGETAVIQRRFWTVTVDSGLSFLRRLRRLGAQTAAPGSMPLSAAALRRILRMFDGGSSVVTYDVVSILWKKEG